MSDHNHSPSVKRDLIWTPFLFFLFRDVKRVYKVKVQTVVIPCVNSFLYLIIFGVSLGQVVSIKPGLSFLHFIIPGLVALGVIVQSFQNGSSSIFGMKITGEIIDVKSTALSLHQIILAVSLSGLLRGFIVGALNLSMGQIFFFIYEGGWMPIHSPLLLVLFVVLGGFGFAGVGLFGAIWAKNFDQIGAIAGLILTPLMYLGGVFFDLDKLSLFWQKVSLLNPLFYFVNGIRHSILGESDVAIFQSVCMAALTVLFAYALALYGLSRGVFQRAV